MAERISIRYGRDRITLRRSATEVAVRPARGRSRAFRGEMDALTRDGRAVEGETLAGFQILKVPAAEVPRAREALARSPATGRPRPVFYTSDTDETPFIPSGALHLLVDPAAADAEIDAMLERHGCRREGMVGRRHRAASSRADTVAVAAELQGEPLVLEAEPDLITPRRLLDIELPTDPKFAAQWHLENRGGGGGLLAGADARVVAAWRRLGGFGATAAVVAVIDDGFDLAHPDLRDKAVAARDFNDAPAGAADPADWGAHGTACAGVAVGTLGEGEIVGAAPNARLMPLTMTAHLSNEEIVRWFDHATASGAWVVSCSWKARAAVFELSSAAFEAIGRCATAGRGGKGAVIVFAAGNDNADVNDPPRTLNGLAIHPDVLAVAASTSMDTRAGSSSMGREIAVCAPSAGAPGRFVTTADFTDGLDAQGRPILRGYGAGAYTATFGGTSSACPLVAGVCALVLGANPELTAAQVRELVRSTARRIGDGYVDGHSRHFGRGCVDAEAAVGAALAARLGAGA